MEGEADLLQLSGLQHFAFCPRQWALIHVEAQWLENERTVDGELFHRRSHDEGFTEKRGDLIITRGMPVSSNRLGVSGKCDVVEFRRSAEGISITRWEGKWEVYPVEYKKGRPKEHDADRLQLCCQAMCLEEMLVCEIPEGSLYYGETRRRDRVEFSREMRQTVADMLAKMHEYRRRGYTPRPKPAKRCAACSLAELCLPAICGKLPVSDYLSAAMGEEDG